MQLLSLLAQTTGGLPFRARDSIRRGALVATCVGGGLWLLIAAFLAYAFTLPA